MAISEYLSPKEFNESALRIWNLCAWALMTESARQDVEAKGERQ